MDISTKIKKINRWRRGDKFSPHKPLLLLLALGALKKEQRLTWEVVKRDLTNLLKRFGGASGVSPRPSYPFLRLQNDGLWSVNGYENFSGDALVSDLNRKNPVGMFKPEVITELLDPTIYNSVVEELLDFFPESYREDLIVSTGVEINEFANSLNRRRSRHFRNQVLNAYNHKCAICCGGIRLGAQSIGLEASHIKFHSLNGPCEISNGLSLCALHHVLFDRGALSLSDEYAVIISPSLN